MKAKFIQVEVGGVIPHIVLNRPHTGRKAVLGTGSYGG